MKEDLIIKVIRNQGECPRCRNPNTTIIDHGPSYSRHCQCGYVGK